MNLDECIWRPWDTAGATYYRPRRIGTLIRGFQDLGYVEKLAKGWEWNTRMIPGPLGEFRSGVRTSELEARAEVERAWAEFPTEVP